MDYRGLLSSAPTDTDSGDITWGILSDLAAALSVEPSKRVYNMFHLYSLSPETCDTLMYTINTVNSEQLCHILFDFKKYPGQIEAYMLLYAQYHRFKLIVLKYTIL